MTFVNAMPKVINNLITISWNRYIEHFSSEYKATSSQVNKKQSQKSN